MNKIIIIVVFILTAIACNSSSSGRPDNQKQIVNDNFKGADTIGENGQSLVYRENASEITKAAMQGELVTQIDFNVSTKNRKDYEDGMIHWISIEHPEKEIEKLIGKDSIVIADRSVAVIIDYPLTVPNKFEMKAGDGRGFTKRQLIECISAQYHKIYEEEEATAKTKTLPFAKRKIMNRNTTDGKYGIWGHDLGDLVLDDILVYRNKEGNLVLLLEIDS